MTIEDRLVDLVNRALNTVTHGLGTVALSDADDEEDMMRHLPDGSGRIVRLMQDEDDAFWITPEMRTLIDGATRLPPAPAAPRARKARRVHTA